MQIPVCAPDGNVLGVIDDQEAESMRSHFEIDRTRKGRARRAVLRVRISLVPLSRHGEAFEQQLRDGQYVWALRGTPGAEAIG